MLRMSNEELIFDNGAPFNKEMDKYFGLQDNSPMVESFFRPLINSLRIDKTSVLKCPLAVFQRRFNITSNIISIIQETLDYSREQNKPNILAGGKLIDFFNNVSAEDSSNDYDIFCIQDAILVPKNLTHISNSCNVCDYCITVDGKDHKVQYVYSKDFVNPENVVQDFDIRCCSIAYDGKDVYWVKGALHDIRRKKIVALNPRRNTLQMFRIAKYIAKGYDIDICEMALFSIKFLDSLKDTWENNDHVKRLFCFTRDHPFDRKQVNDYASVWADDGTEQRAREDIPF